MTTHRFISWLSCGLIREVQVSVEKGCYDTKKILVHRKAFKLLPDNELIKEEAMVRHENLLTLEVVRNNL